MTYSDILVMAVLLLIGESVIIYYLFMENMRLKATIKNMVKMGEDALRIGKSKKPEPKKDNGSGAGKKKFKTKYYE